MYYSYAIIPVTAFGSFISGTNSRDVTEGMFQGLPIYNSVSHYFIL